MRRVERRSLKRQQPSGGEKPDLRAMRLMEWRRWLGLAPDERRSNVRNGWKADVVATASYRSFETWTAVCRSISQRSNKHF